MQELMLDHLVSDAAVSALVSDRIVWNARPQGEALPCVVLHRITGARDYHLMGRSGLVESLVQIDCWAETWVAAKGVARAVGSALDSLVLDPFQRAFLASERDDFEVDADGRGFHRTMLEVRVQHADSI